MAVTILPGPVGPISADPYFAPSPTFLPHHHRCSSSQSTIRPIPIQSPSLPRNTSGRMSASGLTLCTDSLPFPANDLKRVRFPCPVGEPDLFSSTHHTWSPLEYDRTPIEPPSEEERSCFLPKRGERCFSAPMPCTLPSNPSQSPYPKSFILSDFDPNDSPVWSESEEDACSDSPVDGQHAEGSSDDHNDHHYDIDTDNDDDHGDDDDEEQDDDDDGEAVERRLRMAAGLWGGSESSLSDGDVGDDDDLGSAVARCKERLRLWRLGCEEGDSSVHRERLDETDTSDDPETDCEQTPSSSTLVFPITITRQSFSGFPISPSPADNHPDGSTPTPSFHLAASTPTPAFHFPLSTSPTSAMAISPSEASPSSRRLMWARSLNKQFSGHLDDEAPATPSVDGERPPLSIFPRANWLSVSDSPPPTPDWDLTRTMTIPEPSPSSQHKESPKKLPRLTRTDSGFFPSAKPITPSLETLSTMIDLPDSSESSLPPSPAKPVRQSYLVPSYPSDSASVSFPTASLDPSRQSTEPLLFSPSLSVSSSLSLSISDDSLSEGHPLIRPSPPDLSTFSWAHALFREKTGSVAVEGDDRVSFDSW